MPEAQQAVRDVRMVTRQVGWEQRAYWRNPAAAIFTFALPLVFLVIFSSSFGHQRVRGVPGVSYEQYYVPSILTYGLIGACFTNLATSMTFRRDQGILKRVRGTPLPAWAYLAGAIGSSLVVTVLLAVITIGAGVSFFSVPVPTHIAAVVAVVLLGAACFCTLGLAVTVLIPNADAAPPIINIVMLGLLFISGTFFPVRAGSSLARVAGYFPVAHLVRALEAAVVPIRGRAVLQSHDLLVMALWAVGGLVFTVRRFRWESRSPR